MRAQVDQAVDRPRRWGAAGPDRVAGLDVGDVEGLAGANGDGAGHWLDVQDVTRPAVGRRTADPQAPALAAGEAERSVVAADHGPLGLDGPAGGRGEPTGEEPPGGTGRGQ